MFVYNVLEILKRWVIQYDLHFFLLLSFRLGLSFLFLASSDSSEALYHLLHGFEASSALSVLFLAFEHSDVYSYVTRGRYKH